MAKLLMLSGLSRTGKSTIIERLTSEHGYQPYWNNNREKLPSSVKHLPDYFYGMFIMSASMFSMMPDKKFVLDRGFLDELVYSKSLNRETYLNDTQVLHFLDENDFKLIFFDNEYEYYIQNFPKENPYSEKQFNHQRSLFNEIFDGFKYQYANSSWQDRFIKINPMNNKLEEKYKLIKSII
jgi:hypothetical protein